MIDHVKQKEDIAKSRRLERLSNRDDRSRYDHDFVQGYTNFVKIMRRALPMLAALIVIVLYFRMGGQDQLITPVEEVVKAPEISKKSISRNELLNPKFQSMDKKDQPYEITAKRAVQGEINENLIMLEHPEGEMTMKDGMKITMKSDTGAYRQDTERFFLKGNVNLNHDGGYSLQSNEAHFDLKKGYAWSEENVEGSGPDMFVSAKGVHANSNNGEILFTGPAKLVLEKGFEGNKN